jgi:hypothetical protein
VAARSPLPFATLPVCVCGARIASLGMEVCGAFFRFQ